MKDTDKTIWIYKNFNMGQELDISGEFIYDGIAALNEMKCIFEGSPLFSFLYHTSVGIERLQKIIIVLFENINSDEYEKFEKSLITHSHQDLHARIKKNAKINFNSRENDLLTLLTRFYKGARYNRFNVVNSGCKEEELLVEFVEKYLKPSEIEHHFISSKIVVNESVKDLIGKTIGNISSKYYALLRAGANKNGTFTYELVSDSKAEKIFLNNYRKNSLQDMKITESIAVKELVTCIRNADETCAFFRFLDTVEPLGFDVNLINEYLSELARGNIPQSLVDEVETLYEEKGYSKDRVEMVDLIGNTRVDFELGEISDIIKLIDSFMTSEISEETFVKDFVNKATVIEDEEFNEISKKSVSLCRKFLEGKISSLNLKKSIEEHLMAIKSSYEFLECNCVET